MARKFSSHIAFLVALALTGCTTLKPIELEPEFTTPPADTELWQAVNDTTRDSWHVLLNDGPTALDWRLRAIDAATESITMQTFLWHFDTAGALVLDHVLRAADRGVRVRILVDDTFLVHEDELLLAIAGHPNIEYRVFNPFKRRAGGFATRQLLNLAEFGRLDHRMHNKAMVIDNQVAVVGGRNLADEYFGLNDTANFRDLELLLGGPVVEEISNAFDNYWNDRWSVPIEALSDRLASDEQLSEARRVADTSLHLHKEITADEQIAEWLAMLGNADTGKAVLYVDKPPENNPQRPEEAPVQVANELTTLFDEATKEVVIVSAYLIPTPDLEGAVERAIDRGVRVRILTNSLQSNNHVTAHSAYRKHINTLLDHGVQMHEVRIDAEDRAKYMLSPVGRKMLALHAKTMIIDDDKVFIGSANLDPRSLRLNTEMGFLITSRAFNQTVREALEGDFSSTNAWRLELQENGKVFWVSSDDTLQRQPASSFMQRLEDWFFSHLPIESEL